MIKYSKCSLGEQNIVFQKNVLKHLTYPKLLNGTYRLMINDTKRTIYLSFLGDALLAMISQFDYTPNKTEKFNLCCGPVIVHLDRKTSKTPHTSALKFTTSSVL